MFQVKTQAERNAKRALNRKVDRLLERAQTLLAGRDGQGTGWCKGEIARTANGKPTEETNSNATRFCSIGAINRAAADLKCNWDVQREAQNRLERVMVSDPQSWDTIADVNDNKKTTFPQVMMAFDLARVAGGYLRG